ncbi:hypothetical protein FNU76_03095 [Chitinimonas arctica]|uniref:Peptidase M60 domain-containing protein n=2 Tax=Chitinimonas arctica TaxID=2594795 RepID=A0A516SB94_9NEIS|nr:hypothetical protein FNU76_03095 [Chitinimonas arctica]
MRAGDIKLLSDGSVLPKAIKQQIGQRNAEHTDLLQQIWANDSIVYNPTGNSQLLTPISNRDSARMFPLLVGSGGQTLAAAGRVEQSRVAAIGSNLLGNLQAGSAPSMQSPSRRLLAWLLLGKQADIGSARSISLLRYSNGEQAALKLWFKSQYPNWTVTSCNDDSQLTACGQASQLLLVGSQAASPDNGNTVLSAYLKQALAAGKPLLYQHTGSWGDGGFPQAAGLLGLAPLPYAGNYFAKDSANWSNLAAMQAAQGAKLQPQQALTRLVDHLSKGDYTFNWSQCGDDDKRCGGAGGIDQEFYQGAEQVKNWISALEQAGQPVFAADSPALLKQLVLLGDQYRRSVRYPMSKEGTPTAQFMQALYADHALASLRTVTPALDLRGSSFSPALADAVPAAEVSRSFTSRNVEFSTSAAVYALPGRSFTVSRQDRGGGKAWVFVNQLRMGAAHVFGSKYDRPMYLWGNAIPLVSGQTVTVTHPYGGLVYVKLDNATPATNIDLKFNGVGQQAVYSGPDSAATFAANVKSNPLGWSEILTPGFEVHSTSDKMRQSIKDYGDDINRLVSDTWTYLYKDIYNLAAFNGRDLALPASVADFCRQKGWDCGSNAIHGLNGVQHFNTDQANCGYMCSGQPIDSYGSYHPLGWGESHEIGHNLQYGRFKLYGGQSGEISNNIFPVHKWLHYNRDNPNATQYGRDLAQKATFELLQNAQKQPAGNVADYVKNGLWFNENLFWGRLMFYWQAALNSRALPGIGDEGWDLYRLLYLQERLFQNALKSDADWSAERAKLGYSHAAYASRSAVQNIVAEDFMLIGMSYITQRDQRDFFDMWGIRYSANAASQVASYGYAAAPKRFWVVPCESKGFKAPLATPFAVDGKTAWPAAGNCPA